MADLLGRKAQARRRTGHIIFLVPPLERLQAASQAPSTISLRKTSGIRLPIIRRKSTEELAAISYTQRRVMIGPEIQLVVSRIKQIIVLVMDHRLRSLGLTGRTKINLRRLAPTQGAPPSMARTTKVETHGNGTIATADQVVQGCFVAGSGQTLQWTCTYLPSHDTFTLPRMVIGLLTTDRLVSDWRPNSRQRHMHLRRCPYRLAT